MVAGVIVFTFISGALASVITSFDESSAALNEQMLYLNKLQKEYHLPRVLSNSLKLYLVRDVNSS